MSLLVDAYRQRFADLNVTIERVSPDAQHACSLAIRTESRVPPAIAECLPSQEDVYVRADAGQTPLRVVRHSYDSGFNVASSDLLRGPAAILLIVIYASAGRRPHPLAPVNSGERYALPR